MSDLLNVKHSIVTSNYHFSGVESRWSRLGFVKFARAKKYCQPPNCSYCSFFFCMSVFPLLVSNGAMLISQEKNKL